MCQLSVVPQETSDSRTLGRKVYIMCFFNLNLFKVCVYVCVCVCMYVYMCVCVCVCVWIDLRNFFSFLFSECLVLFFSGLTSVLATPFVSSRRFSLFSEWNSSCREQVAWFCLEGFPLLHWRNSFSMHAQNDGQCYLRIGHVHYLPCANALKCW